MTRPPRPDPQGGSPPPIRHRLRTAAGAGLVALLAGCVVPVPGDGPLDVTLMSREELRDYAERVFRRHNRVVTHLMMTPIPAGAAEADRARLERAESAMNRACSDLNRLASARASGSDVAVTLEDRVRRSVRRCDERTARMQDVLLQVGIPLTDER